VNDKSSQANRSAKVETEKRQNENLEQDNIGIGFCFIWLIVAKQRRKINDLQN